MLEVMGRLNVSADSMGSGAALQPRPRAPWCGAPAAAGERAGRNQQREAAAYRAASEHSMRRGPGMSRGASENRLRGLEEVLELEEQRHNVAGHGKRRREGDERKLHRAAAVKDGSSRQKSWPAGLPEVTR